MTKPITATKRRIRRTDTRIETRTKRSFKLIAESVSTATTITPITTRSTLAPITITTATIVTEIVSKETMRRITITTILMIKKRAIT